MLAGLSPVQSLEEAPSVKQVEASLSLSSVFKGDNSDQCFSPKQSIITLPTPLKASIKYLLISLLLTLATSEPIPP